MNHMRERHLDGTVLMRQAAGGVFEPLARPDLLITDADRAHIITSRRRDRDAALIGMSELFILNELTHVNLRYDYCNFNISLVSSSAMRLEYADSGTFSPSGSTLELFAPEVPHMSSFANR
jgi:hypothetical protein